MENRKLFPGLESRRCGPAAEVLWLPASAPIDDGAIEARLDAAERSRAESLKAPERRSEYRRARFLIRTVTGFTGPLPPAPGGGPTWPPGLVGSLTHKTGHVGVAMAPAERWLALGIDVEDVDRVKEGFERHIANAAEGALVDAVLRRHGGDRRRWLAVIFSFKEALFKCHFPLGREMFYFHDAEVTRLDPATGEIAAAVLTQTSPRTPAGFVTAGHFAWLAEGEQQLVLSAASLPAP